YLWITAGPGTDRSHHTEPLSVELITVTAIGILSWYASTLRSPRASSPRTPARARLETSATSAHRTGWNAALIARIRDRSSVGAASGTRIRMLGHPWFSITSARHRRDHVDLVVYARDFAQYGHRTAG